MPRLISSESLDDSCEMRRIDSIQNGVSKSLSAMTFRAGLWCASQPYGAAVSVRNWLYDRGWLASNSIVVPVISVGNLTAGGTGKTPAVAFLARWFREKKIRVAILSRGYASLQDGINDEAKELEKLLPDVPHLQSPDRFASAKIACDELGMEALILDDGFQHRQLRRNLDIVLIDALEPFGHQHLLPRGLLREPIQSLQRADIVIATRADQVDAQSLANMRNRVQRYNPRAAWIEAEHEPIELINSDGQTESLTALDQKKVIAVSGIGNPGGFERSLLSTGAQLLEHVRYADHFPFSSHDIETIGERAAHHAAQQSTPCDAIICTGKDLAKIATPRIGGVPLWALRIEFKIRSGLNILEEHLNRLLPMIEN